VIFGLQAITFTRQPRIVQLAQSSKEEHMLQVFIHVLCKSASLRADFCIVGLARADSVPEISAYCPIMIFWIKIDSNGGDYGHIIRIHS